MLKIALENGKDLTGGHSVGPVNDTLNALFMSMEMELGGALVTKSKTEYAIELLSKIYSTESLL